MEYVCAVPENKQWHTKRHPKRVRLALSGGIGATGSGMKQFFYPGKKIREKWPNDEKLRLTGVLVIGYGKQHVNKKEHMCYLVCSPKIDDSSTLHIMKKNFKVDIAPPAGIFESKTPHNNNVEQYLEMQYQMWKEVGSWKMQWASRTFRDRQ